MRGVEPLGPRMTIAVRQEQRARKNKTNEEFQI